MNSLKKFVLFVVIVVLCVLGLYRWKQTRHLTRPEKYTPAEGPSIDLKDVKILDALDREFTNLVDSVVPSVVSITTSKRVQQGYAIDFYRRLLIPQERVMNALGSGVIVSKEGHILTNNHVVAGVDEINVQLSDGRVVPARFIGSDPETDVAVLKIDEKNVTPLPFGDSDQVRVGQRVVAVGNPFGLEETVTQGIISAKGRVSADSGSEYFQTDTAINPGNSGGPLVNLHGEIVGINSAIGGQTGNWAGVGFAIPSNQARRVMESILKNGRSVRGYIGIVIQPVTPDLATQFGAANTKGAMVIQAAPGSPAERAGLRKGDIILKVDGHVISGVPELPRRVGAVEVGGTVEMVILRDGQEQTVKLQVTEKPANFTLGRQPQQQQPQIPKTPQPQIPTPAPSQTQGENVFAGLRVIEIPLAHRNELPADIAGVMVAEIVQDSAAAVSLKPGDVIEEINRQKIASVADYEKVVAGIPARERVVLFICRDQQRSFVVLSPAPGPRGLNTQ
jgi:serine protease Do